MEFFWNIVCIVFVASLGASRQVDHFMMIITVWFGVSVLPSFYFMACADFRRDLHSHGVVKAFWIAFTKDSYYN